MNCLRSGGAEKQLLWIASEIVSLGIPCSILELAAGERTERIEAMVRVALEKGVLVLRAPPHSGNWQGLGRLRRHLSDTRPDLIWSWGLRADGICYLGRLLNAPTKWIMSIRSANTQLGNFGSWIRKQLARRCDGVISNTHAGLVMSEIQYIPTLRQWVLPNAVALDSSTQVDLPDLPPQRLVLVMLGNIKIMTKGYDLAAQLAQILLGKAFLFELRIAGRPDELAELETIFHRLNVQSVVKFYGEVSHPEEFLREGHLFLLLSRFEGMPNTLLEALSVGLPAIATDVGDLRVLKDKGAPFDLVPIENVKAATEAVERALAQWSNTRVAAAKGRGWVQANFSEEACRAVLREILAEVLEA
ncbi:MAG: glycosyltransferase [Opitutae bacterium]|nr:glycosyltransferase [Opitutae bacterium]